MCTSVRRRVFTAKFIPEKRREYHSLSINRGIFVQIASIQMIIYILKEKYFEYIVKLKQLVEKQCS